VTRLQVEWLGFDSQQRHRIFLFATISTLALRPTQPSIQWILRALSLRVKGPGHEADHTPLSSIEVKNAWSYTSTPSCIFMAGYSSKYRDFTFQSNL
jgi:hypothetical protein